MATKNNFGETLRRLREEKGITRSAFAASAGVSSCEEADLENGVRKPRASTLKKISDALGVPTSTLIAELRKDIEND